MGDKDGNGKGSFILIDGTSLEVTGTWQNAGDETPFGYDFWYQPRHNVMVSTEWGTPKNFCKGFNPQDVAEGQYGNSLHIWEWKGRKHVKSINLGPEGLIPLEVRFLHEPTSNVGFVGCALSSTVFRIFQDEGNQWQAEKVISEPAVNVTGWALPSMPALITDILISIHFGSSPFQLNPFQPNATFFVGSSSQRTCAKVSPKIRARSCAKVTGLGASCARKAR